MRTRKRDAELWLTKTTTMLTDRDYFLLEHSGDLLDYRAIFDNDNPVYIEIGCGKGEFISQYSMLHPEWNFLGFEGREKRIRNILKKVSPANNPNVRLLCLMIDSNIAQVLPPQSIQGAFIQHPDPWPKKRHHKRRLIQQDFLNALASILMPDAQLHISTDHEEYANWIAEEFLKNANFLSLHDQPIQKTPSLADHVTTWYEKDQRRQGFEPNFMLYKRI